MTWWKATQGERPTESKHAGEDKTGQRLGGLENAGHHGEELVQDRLRGMATRPLRGPRTDKKRRVAMLHNNTSKQRLKMRGAGV